MPLFDVFDVSPVDSNWHVMFGLTGNSTGMTAYAFSVVNDESKIDQERMPRMVCLAFSR